MSWNIVPECVSTIMLCIIWIYSRNGNHIPSLKNRLFQLCFPVTFCAMASNILSTWLIYSINEYTIGLTWVINMIYFIVTPLMSLLYFFYVLTNIFEGEEPRYKLMFVCAVPGIIYGIMILLNPFTRSIFNVTLAEGYTQGPLIAVTYIVFYMYCFGCMFAVLFFGKRLQLSIRVILFTFPLMAAIVIIVQMIFPVIILSGSAATCALLLIYLFQQNKGISIDYLTGVPNRQEFLKMLELKIRRKSQSHFPVIIISMKEFKLINDTYGQYNGDEFLKSVCNYLIWETTDSKGQLYRYSGDEFAILLHKPDEEALKRIIRGILHRMSQPWEIADCTSHLDAAIGVVWYPDCADQMKGMINGIEYSVALAKNDKANNNVCICTPQIIEKARRKQQIGNILKENLVKGGFEVYFQPILSVADRKFHVAEALLRINESPLGMLSPGEFIPIAEEYGLIADMTYMVLDEVCKFVRRLMEQGIDFEGINVNFSPMQFMQKDLMDKIKTIIIRNDIPASKIIVEITESTLAENTESVSECINRMHEMGIRIGLDDFGTGYSNMTSVISLPFDTIKLDKSFVWSAMKNERSAIIVRNMTRTFCELGMMVLAEGVETPEQSRLVEDCGCSLIQGFLYALPMQKDPFIAFITENNRQGLPR